MANRELTTLELQFKEEAERKYPGYYDFKPYINGFLEIETRNAFAGWLLALELHAPHKLKGK
jgi:hypothetical protein